MAISIAETLEFVIPQWAVCAIEHGDYSGLNDDDETAIKAFLDSEIESLGDNYPGFSSAVWEYGDEPYPASDNDITSLGDTVIDCKVNVLVESAFDDDAQKAIAQELTAIASDIPWDEWDDEGYPVRLRYLDGSWEVLRGSPDWDTDHNGVWAASSLWDGMDDDDFMNVANGLIDEIEDQL